MRLRNRQYLRPRAGETRVVRKFLWFPKSFGGGVTRWLESADILQRIEQTAPPRLKRHLHIYEWADVGFNDLRDHRKDAILSILRGSKCG